MTEYAKEASLKYSFEIFWQLENQLLLLHFLYFSHTMLKKYVEVIDIVFVIFLPY